MKYVTFLGMAWALFFAVGCKKPSSSQPGSPYAKLIAGSRNFLEQSTLTIGNQPTTVFDTVTLDIQYINDVTLEINSVKLYYSSTGSDSNSIVFTYINAPTSSNPPPYIDAELIYDPKTNYIYYSISDYISAGGSSQTDYRSF